MVGPVSQLIGIKIWHPQCHAAESLDKQNLRGFSPQANYTDRDTADTSHWETDTTLSSLPIELRIY
jgi:hypothetical protein